MIANMSDYTISTIRIKEHQKLGIINDYIMAYKAGAGKNDKNSYLMKCRMMTGIAIPSSIIRYSNAFNQHDIRIPDMIDWRTMLTTEGMEEIDEITMLRNAIIKAADVNDRIMQSLNDNNMLSILTVRLLALYFSIRNLIRISDYDEKNRKQVRIIANELGLYLNAYADMLIDEPPVVNDASKAGMMALSEAGGAMADAGSYTSFKSLPSLITDGVDLFEIIINRIDDSMMNSIPVRSNTINADDSENSDYDGLIRHVSSDDDHNVNVNMNSNGVGGSPQMWTNVNTPAHNATGDGSNVVQVVDNNEVEGGNVPQNAQNGGSNGVSVESGKLTHADEDDAVRKHNRRFSHRDYIYD